MESLVKQLDDSEQTKASRTNADLLENTELMRELSQKVIPVDPDQFYDTFGWLSHPDTHKPVKRLAPYQREVWKSMQRYKYNLIVKSQKIGLSTSVLLADFQMAILPSTHPLSCRGYEILLIAQTLGHAREHLYTLRKMIHQSAYYRRFLIDRPTEYLMRDEVTKVTVLHFHNPSNPRKPTRIIGLGATEGSIWSWKEVKLIHISDIAGSKLDYTGAINAALTRLANTNGNLIIETPPSRAGPVGKVYEIYQRSLERTETDSPEGQFKVRRITANEAVAAGVITEQKLEEYRRLFGSEFPTYFEAEFINIGGNVFPVEDVDRAELLGKRVDWRHPRINMPKALGYDPGFGSSKAGVVVAQMWNGKIEVVYAQEFDKASPIGVAEMIHELYLRWKINRIYVDASRSGEIRDLKEMVGEDVEYERKLSDIRKKHHGRIKADQLMTVVPMNFGAGGGNEMLHHLQDLLHKGYVAIPSEFKSLLRQLRVATEVNGSLDKTGPEKFDLLDAFRLAAWYFRFNDKVDVNPRVGR